MPPRKRHVTNLLLDYESHFILLTNKIDELTKRLHKGTASHIKESNGKKSQLATLPDDLWKRSNKTTMHPYEIPKKKKEFEYVESSRCKYERAKMIGDTCTCCAKVNKIKKRKTTSC
jgi:hypothetical protein